MRRIIVTFIALWLATVTAFAQSNTGRIVGAVTSTDGVIPGATIKIKDNQTNKERTVTSASDGAFIVPQLEVGTYTINVTAAGFKTYEATNVKVDVGQEYSLQVALEVGRVEETVTVTAGADLVNATNGSLSTTVSPRTFSLIVP